MNIHGRFESRSRFCLCAAAALLISFGMPALATEPPPAPPVAAPAEKPPGVVVEGPAVGVARDQGYVRITEDRNAMIALQVGRRTFTRPRPAEEAGAPAGEAPAAAPPVTLVAVAHIGEARLYEELQQVLDSHEVVLFESVRPPGAPADRPPGDAAADDKRTDDERISYTRRSMRFVASVLEAAKAKDGFYPVCTDDLGEFAAGVDTRLRWFVSAALVDGWGRRLNYETAEQAYSLTSLGSDGRPGGEGPATDLSAAEFGVVPPLHTSGDEGLQSELARTLGLAYQLDAIDYDRANWRCSDMAMDELDAAMRERGLEFAPLQGALAGSSLPAQIVKLMLGLVRFANRLSEGAVTDMIKVMLIELLGDEAVTQQAIAQFGQGLSDVLIGQRNQVVIDDLQAIMQREPATKSIAVFYGAGHMPDLVERMEKLGYQPAGPTEWTTAIVVDMKKSKMSPAELRQLRTMLRQMMREQFGRAAGRASRESPVKP